MCLDLVRTASVMMWIRTRRGSEPYGTPRLRRDWWPSMLSTTGFGLMTRVYCPSWRMIGACSSAGRRTGSDIAQRAECRKLGLGVSLATALTRSNRSGCPAS